jgi:hypothetical protein
LVNSFIVSVGKSSLITASFFPFEEIGCGKTILLFGIGEPFWFFQFKVKVALTLLLFSKL